MLSIAMSYITVFLILKRKVKTLSGKVTEADQQS